MWLSLTLRTPTRYKLWNYLEQLTTTDGWTVSVFVYSICFTITINSCWLEFHFQCPLGSVLGWLMHLVNHSHTKSLLCMHCAESVMMLSNHSQSNANTHVPTLPPLVHTRTHTHTHTLHNTACKITSVTSELLTLSMCLQFQWHSLTTTGWTTDQCFPPPSLKTINFILSS